MQKTTRTTRLKNLPVKISSIMFPLQNPKFMTSETLLLVFSFSHSSLFPASAPLDHQSIPHFPPSHACTRDGVFHTLIVAFFIDGGGIILMLVFSRFQDSRFPLLNILLSQK
eukprot:Sdes_comp19485_c0_seq1m10974